jgi:hypothetical protein
MCSIALGMDPIQPHRALLDEISRRLFRGEMTEGWSCEPHGDSYDDAWGAGQWVTFETPDGERRTLLVTVVRP